MIEKSSVSLLQVGLLVVLTYVFNLVKGGYYATYLMPCIVIGRHINQKKTQWLKRTIYVGLVIVIISFFVFPSFRQRIFPIGLSYQEQIIFSEPLYFFRALVFSMFSEQFFWINGIVGTFGWLEYKVPYLFIVLYYIIFGIVSYQLTTHDKKQLSFTESLIVLCIPLVTYVFIVYNFLLYETPPGYPTVQSIQGRYFLVVIPFIVYGLSQLYANRSKLILVLGSIALLVGTFGIIIGSIYIRYYDFSKTVANLPDLQKRIENEEIPFDNKPLQIASSSMSLFTVETGKKISGFQLVNASTTTPVDIPYRYTISDGGCQKIIESGLINPTMVQKKGLVTIYTKVFQVESNTVCLILRPAIEHITTVGYWSIETSNSLPIGQFLYISQ
jgi:hypothetical protein